MKFPSKVQPFLKPCSKFGVLLPPHGFFRMWCTWNTIQPLKISGGFGPFLCRAMCIKARCGGRCVAGDVYAIKVLQKGFLVVFNCQNTLLTISHPPSFHLDLFSSCQMEQSEGFQNAVHFIVADCVQPCYFLRHDFFVLNLSFQTKSSCRTGS